jgi:hypothetical protein
MIYMIVFNHSQLKLNHLNNTLSTKAAGGGIYSGDLLKDIKVSVKVRRTLSSVGTSSSNTPVKDGLLIHNVLDHWAYHAQREKKKKRM